MTTGGVARRIGCAVVGADVTTGTEVTLRWDRLVWGTDVTGADAVVDAVVDIVVGAVSGAVAGVAVDSAAAGAGGDACTMWRPGTDRAARIANIPAPATADTATARVIRVKRRAARSRAKAA